MSRSRRQKKKFGGCSHRGYGKYCHYCKQQRDGYDFKKDRGKTDKEREEARIQAEQDKAEAEQATGETDARLEAEAKWEWDEQQRAAEEERHRNEDYQPPLEDFEG